MEEIWKDIEGYEGLYQVSNYGRVKSLDHIVSNHTSNIISKGKILKERINRKGYISYALYKKNQSKNIKAHRLVAIAFIPNPENKPQVNHIDGNKQNNRVDNLEWCTNKENQIHAWENGLITAKKGGQVHNAKPILKFDLDGNFIKEYDCIINAVRDLEIRTYKNISKCCKGKYEQAYGFKWKYKEE